MKIKIKNSSMKFESVSELYRLTNNESAYVDASYHYGNAQGWNANLLKVNSGDVITITGKTAIVGASYAVYAGVPSSLTDFQTIRDFTLTATVVRGGQTTSGPEITINDTFTVSQDNCILITTNTNNNTSRTLKIVKNGVALN